MQGICRICGEHKKLTFEHTPPQAAFNRLPVYIQKSEHLHNEQSFLFGKKMRSNRGAGGYTLCKKCNNDTGGYYGDSFTEFAQQGALIPKWRVWASRIIPSPFYIEPLNVLKEILVMFMAIDTSDHLLKYDGLKQFVLEKESQDIPKGLRVFIYYTNSISVRNGWSLMHNFKEQTNVQLGELTFRPFGYIYTIDETPTAKNAFEITDWVKYKYNQKERLLISLPFLEPIGYMPGIYN